jgi:DNA-directed RNA polymerase omega subunit
MVEKDKTVKERPCGDADVEHCEEIDSRFRLIVVASLRSKQLQRGARPRIEADVKKRRSTSIAIEEVMRGLVPFTINSEKHKNGGGAERGKRDEREGFGDGQADT